MSETESAAPVTDGPVRRSRLHGPALFLLGTAAGSMVDVQARVLLPPALHLPVLEAGVLCGGLMGLALGLAAGTHRARTRGIPGAVAAAGTVLPALLLGGLGAFPEGVAGGTELLHTLAQGAGLDRSLPLSCLGGFFLAAILLPFALAFSAGARSSPQGNVPSSDRSYSALLAGGAAAGLLCLPWLVRLGTGLPAVLQGWALLSLLASVPYLGQRPATSRFHGPEAPEGSSPRATTAQAALVTFGLALCCGTFICWIRWYEGGDGFTPFRTAGWILAGIGMAALARPRWRGRGKALFGPALVALILVLGVVLFSLAPPRPAGVPWTPLFLLFLGIAAGLAPARGPDVIFREGAFGSALGLAASLGLLLFLVHPATRPMITLAAGGLPFLLLERPGRGNHVPYIRVLACGAALAATLWYLRPPLPEGYPGGRPVAGTLLDLRLDPPAAEAGISAGLAVCGRDPFGAPMTTAASVRRAFLSVLFHPDPKRVLVLGPDPGLVASEALRDPMVKTVEWVDPWGLASGRCGWERNAVESKGNAPVSPPAALLPARLFLERRPGTYDLVIIPPDPFARYRRRLPWTRSFYGTAIRALKPGGVICQWIFPHRMDHGTFTTLLATTCRAFPELYLFTDHPRAGRPALALVGGRRPFLFSEAHTRNRLRMAGRIDLFSAAGLDPVHLGVNYVTHKEVLEIRLPVQVFEDGAPPFPVVEGSPAALHCLVRNLAFLQGLRRPPPPGFRWEDLPEGDRAKRRARADYLLKAGAVMVEGTLGRIQRRAFDPGEDLASPASLDDAEALVLARALGTWQPYPYLKDLLLAKAAAMERKGEKARALKLLEACASRVRWDDAFTRARDVLAARIEKEQGEGTGKSDAPPSR